MNDAVREEPVDEFVDITWSIIGSREIPPDVEDYLDTVFDELGRMTGNNVVMLGVSSNDDGHTYRSLEHAYHDLRARIGAAARLLVAEGHATPYAQHLLDGILAEGGAKHPEMR